MKPCQNIENKHYLYSQIEDFVREKSDEIDKKILVHLSECRECLKEYVNKRSKYESTIEELNRLLILESKITSLSQENRENIQRMLWRENGSMSYEEFVTENERSFKDGLSQMDKGEEFEK